MSDCGLCEGGLHGEAAGHYLCPGCARATVERLGRMPALYEALAFFLRPAGRRPEFGRAPRSEAPLPVAEPVLSLRGPGGMVGVLEDWRSALHADLGWSEPRRRGDTAERVTRAADGLRDNVLWIASSWPPAGAFAEEIRDLERDVVSVVDPPERARRLGACITLTSDGAECGAVLRVPHGTVEVRCSWCGTVWPPDTWLTLASRQPAAMDSAP